MVEVGILIDESKGLPAGGHQLVEVAQDVCQPEVSHAGLAGTEHCPLPPQPQILLGQAEAIGGGHHCVDPGFTFLGAGFGDEHTRTPVLAATHPSSKLVKLRQTEPVGILDDHDGGIGDVDSDFDDRRGYEDVDLARPEAGHDSFLFA